MEGPLLVRQNRRNPTSTILIGSALLIAALLSFPKESNADRQSPTTEACSDALRLKEGGEFEPVQLDDRDGSRMPSVSVLELSAQIPRQAKKLFQDAIKALRNSRPTDAQQLLTKALAVEPQYFQASTLLAALLFNSRNYPAAQRYAERARDSNPQYLPALEILGALDVLGGEYPKGIAELSEVVRLAPRRQAPHHYLGVALLRQGQCADASRHFKTVADIRLNPPKYKLRFKEPGISAYQPAWPPIGRGRH